MTRAGEALDVLGGHLPQADPRLRAILFICSVRDCVVPSHIPVWLAEVRAAAANAAESCTSPLCWSCLQREGGQALLLPPCSTSMSTSNLQSRGENKSLINSNIPGQLQSHKVQSRLSSPHYSRTAKLHRSSAGSCVSHLRHPTCVRGRAM